MRTDLIIIGAGPGGYRAAEYAARQGLSVTIFEKAEVGGTCLNVGCIPTKTYAHASSFDEAHSRMQQVVAKLRSGVEQILTHSNITLIRSAARFQNATSVEACNEDGSTTVYTAPNIIIATGSSLKLLPLSDISDPRLVDSTGLLSLETQPRRLCIIGAGVIGMEFASIFQHFGSEVTVMEFLKECLPMLDSDIAKRLRKLLEKRGIKFLMKTAVKQLSDIEADTILMATGRKPNTEGLNLAAVGISLSPGGPILTDKDYLAASTPNARIYAIGDVNGQQMLAHAAEMQGIHVVNHILGKSDGIRFDIMPAAIFTEPEAACVGPTEEQLKTQGVAYSCHKSFWRANGKALAMGQTEGLLKLFAADDDGRILGCHAYGAHAADIVQEVAALMNLNATIKQLADIVHIHPTLSEILKSAAE